MLGRSVGANRADGAIAEVERQIVNGGLRDRDNFTRNIFWKRLPDMNRSTAQVQDNQEIVGIS